ncbi:hypothetical protein OAU50_08470, partial [Planctomycetota bacterium]|nr:hypothetical protein [Planctomycetota bacterium]
MQKWAQATFILFAIGLAVQLSAQEPDIAYYTFNQTSGQSVPNLADPGQGANPAFMAAAPSWQTSGGPASGAMNEYINVSGQPNGIETGIALPSSGDFTIEFWLRTSSNQLEGILTNKDDFHITVQPDGHVRWDITAGESVESRNPINDGNWHHIACVYDQRGGNDRADIYTDGGSRERENVNPYPSWGPTTCKLLVFDRYDAYTGDFDEFRWWDSRRTGNQIRNTDDIELLPSQAFVFGPNLANIPDNSTYTHPDIPEQSSVVLPFEFHNLDTQNYTAVSASITGQSGATASIATQTGGSVATGNFTPFSIDLDVMTVAYSIDVEIDYTRNGTPLTYTFTIAGNTRNPLPDWMYYRFNEGTGNTTANDAGAPATATFTGGQAWNTTDPQHGNASVEATSGYLDTGFAPTVVNGNDFTLEWWMRTSTTSGTQGIASAGTDVAFGLFNGELTIKKPGEYWYVNINTTVNDNTWHHVAFVYTTATGNLEAFLDGISIANRNFPINFTGADLDLFRFEANTNAPFQGELDEFRLWDGLIVPPEIIDNSGGEIVPDIVVHRPLNTVIPHNGTDSITGASAGVSVNLDYTVENAGQTTLDVTSASITPVANCTVVPLTTYNQSLGENATAPLSVSVTPTASGYFEATLVINSNDPDTATYTITISGIATGVQDLDVQRPASTSIPHLSTDTVNGTTENVATNLLYTLDNSGGAVLNISGVTGNSSGTCTVTVNSFPATIGASSTGTLDIDITPLVDGAFSASFTVNSNDPNTPAYTVTVAGNAQGQPNLVVRDSSLAIITDTGSDTINGTIASATT